MCTGPKVLKAGHFLDRRWRSRSLIGATLKKLRVEEEERLVV